MLNIMYSLFVFLVVKNKEVHRTFVKLHIPWKTLSQKGEQIMLKAPLMESDIRVKSWGERVLGEYDITMWYYYLIL